MFIETSAKGGYNVKQMFAQIAAALPGMGSANANANNNNVQEQKVVLTDEPVEAKEDKKGCKC